MKPEISVIIPVYNMEKYLAKCFDSVLTQDFDSFEIIAVNDGSTDKSLEIAQGYEAKYSDIIKVVTQKNKGLGGARNTGIEKASGKYLFFLDSDDSIKPGALKELYKEITDADADIAFFGIDFVDENGKVITTVSQTDKDREIVTLGERSLIFAKDSYAWDKLYKRSLFVDNDIKFPDKAWYEDLATEPKAVLNAEKLVILKKPYYNYLQREGSIMHNPNTDKNIDMITAVQSVISYYKERKAFEQYYSELEFLAVFHILVLCTLRVAGINPRHPLLRQFYNFTKENFPNFKSNKYIDENLSFRYKLIYAFSVRKIYFLIYLMAKIYNLLKKFK